VTSLTSYESGDSLANPFENAFNSTYIPFKWLNSNQEFYLSKI
jgi:hypothetical protein